MQSTAFRKGSRQIAPKDKESLKRGIMKILGVSTVQSYYYYERGEREPKLSQAIAIEKLFAKFGVTEIWGKR